jgi:hypothetical protein
MKSASPFKLSILVFTLGIISCSKSKNESIKEPLLTPLLSTSGPTTVCFENDNNPYDDRGQETVDL